jgi:peptidoglycan/LPS O-acetylase OafA/YrhL
MLIPAIRLACLVPMLAGGGGALWGPAALGEAGGAATGSHLRYLSGLLLGMGLCAFWCAGDLRRRGAIFSALCAIFVLGGAARALGVVTEGAPPWPHLLALVMELGVVPALWAWARLTRAA